MLVLFLFKLYEMNWNYYMNNKGDDNEVDIDNKEINLDDNMNKFDNEKIFNKNEEIKK